MRRAELTLVAALLAISVLLVSVAGGLAALAVGLQFVGAERPTGLVLGLVLAGGLMIGIALDVRYLRTWMDGFYKVSLSRLVWLFILFSFPAMALGMGVPVNNLAFGALAGLYVGRRHVHVGLPPELLRPSALRVARFTGAVVVVLSFPMGMLAIYGGEEGVAREIVEAVGLHYSRFRGISLVAVLCGVLYAVQYWLAQGAAVLGSRLGGATP